MAALIQHIAKNANLVFGKTMKEDSFKEAFLRLKDFLNQLRAQDINLSQDCLQPRPRHSAFRQSAPVTYVDLFENENFTMGVFIVHSGGEIPLHDHPSMFGLIKVLSGRLSIASYTPLSRDKVTGLSISKFQKVQANDIKVCALHQDIIVGCEDAPCVLEPADGNIHKICSVNGPAAFLDILAPPYNMEDRDCHYYRLLNEIPDSRLDRLYWLKEIPTPPTFWCDSLPYYGPPISTE